MSKKHSDLAMDVAEASRQKEPHRGFVGGLLSAETRFHLFKNHSYRERVRDFYQHDSVSAWLRQHNQFLIDHVDSEIIDREGEIPQNVIDGLTQLGFFGLKQPSCFGGQAFSLVDYLRVVMAWGSFDASITALGSAHNSIGLGGPLHYFGTPEQQKKYYPELCSGSISGLCLTEDDVGSDPSKIKTYAIREKTLYGLGFEVNGYRLFGEKLYTTNGPRNDTDFLARYLVVIARIVDRVEDLNDLHKTPCFGAFIVDTRHDGVCVGKRLQFSGLRGIYNGVIIFSNYSVHVSDRLGQEGDGLRVALDTLTVGRMSLPTACLGGMKQCLRAMRHWAANRKQWGKRIGDHELIAQKIVRTASRIVALEGMIRFSAVWAESGEDIRLESAVLKVTGSEWLWEAIDDLIQIRGGRGYETQESLRERGQWDVPCERMMRDARINRIFEGTNEILRLWTAREALAPIIDLGMAFQKTGHTKYAVQAARRIMNTFLKSLSFSRDRYCGDWRRRLISKLSRQATRLALASIVLYREKLERRQVLITHLASEAQMIFTMASATEYADVYRDNRFLRRLADYFLLNTNNTPHLSGRVSFDNTLLYGLCQSILDGEAEFLEEGIIKMNLPSIDSSGMIVKK